jgi:hypothetical protein
MSTGLQPYPHLPPLCREIAIELLRFFVLGEQGIVISHYPPEHTVTQAAKALTKRFYRRHCGDCGAVHRSALATELDLDFG